ncbi:MAG: acyl-CoA reductase [Bacteroidota bacterium]|nr:acyl-CoA reductase [Bacteroidota bacterium]
MDLNKRIEVLEQLGKYMTSNEQEWKDVKEKAYRHNPWFLPEFIEIAVQNISNRFLNREVLIRFVNNYNLPPNNVFSKKIGIVMAGNIPLVGFHDFLCTFLTGHKAIIKLSSKDDILLKHLVNKLKEYNEEAEQYVFFQDMLKDCDAYIATGSYNTSRYFEYYFKKYPHIIRKNKTSVAILTGEETTEEMDKLAEDVYLFFGLGCRNVTKIFVPYEYAFVPLLDAFNKYSFLSENNKYMNNYDYQLSILILNKKHYMTNGSLLVVEDPSVFSPIGQLNFEYYSDVEALEQSLKSNEAIQCIAGAKNIVFGEAQCPAIDNFADGVDTIKFLLQLNSKR